MSADKPAPGSLDSQDGFSYLMEPSLFCFHLQVRSEVQKYLLNKDIGTKHAKLVITILCNLMM